MSEPAPDEVDPREVCRRCRRPAKVCVCSHVTELPTRTRVLVLQHPKEAKVPIGTAHMASMCLPSASVAVGVELQDHPLVRAMREDPSSRPVLVYPAADARDLATLTPADVGTIVVLDGTWALAKKLYRKNPWLADLPRVRFVPPRPSGYEIRREPKPDYVSTIEALSYALEALEGRDFSAMLRPFHAMVETQKHLRDTIGHSRHAARKKPRLPRVPRAFVDAARLVCLAGEANAWPRAEVGAPKDELVQVVAMRLGSGERFEARIAPRHPLAPSTAFHTKLPEDALLAGGSPEACVAGLDAFLREDDVLCTWGHYASTLLKGLGARLPREHRDLRVTVAHAERRRPGTLEGYTSDLSVDAPSFEGRGGERLAMVVAVAKHLSARAREAAK